MTAPFRITATVKGGWGLRFGSYGSVIILRMRLLNTKKIEARNSVCPSICPFSSVRNARFSVGQVCLVFSVGHACQLLHFSARHTGRVFFDENPPDYIGSASHTARLPSLLPKKRKRQQETLTTALKIACIRSRMNLIGNTPRVTVLHTRGM